MRAEERQYIVLDLDDVVEDLDHVLFELDALVRVTLLFKHVLKEVQHCPVWLRRADFIVKAEALAALVTKEELTMFVVLSMVASLCLQSFLDNVLDDIENAFGDGLLLGCVCLTLL